MLNLLPPIMLPMGIAPPIPPAIRAKIAAHAAKSLPKTPPPPLAAAREVEVAIGVYMKHGRTRAQAVRAVIDQHPELHARWIAEVNHG